MVEWSKDYGMTIGSLNLNFGLMDDLWLNWRPGMALRWNIKTVGWEGRGVVCGKPALSRLYPPHVSV
jgi:hypothetical protein